MVGGVAGGLGDYFGMDPVIFRLLFIVGALAGGIGILAYLAAWLLIPETGEPGGPSLRASPPDRASADLDRHRVARRRRSDPPRERRDLAA